MKRAILLALALVHSPAIMAHAADAPLVQTGTVDIDQTRVSFLLSGSGGGGVLHFKGRDYRFSVGGLGVGGIGISTLKARGEVYNLYDPLKFPGTYTELRTGVAMADNGSGKLWLRNGDILLKLSGASEGIALSMGAGAVNISFK